LLQVLRIVEHRRHGKVFLTAVVHQTQKVFGEDGV
jgi:hypothetical protein